MSLLLGILAAFGGGVFAAAVGGVPAFIFTGVFSIVGACIGFAGAGDAANFVVNNMAFGCFFGPHISFAGAVAAAAYAKKKGSIENGADIISCLAGLNEADVLAVGGVFGVIGFLFKEFVVNNLFAGTISTKLVTDGPGFTVFCSAILVRLIFGGKLFTGKGNIVSEGKAFTNCLMISFGYALVVSGVYVYAIEAGGVPVETISGFYHVLIFGMAAIGLTFAVAGQAFYGCHHIVIIAAEAVVAGYAKTGSALAAIVIGVICGVISGIICDAEGCLINCGTDSHIDGPATAIFIMTFVVNAIFG